MVEPVGRRRLLAVIVAGVGTGAVAGFLEQPPRRTSRAVLVRNETDESLTVTIRLYALPATAGSATATATDDTATPGPSATGSASEDESPTATLEEVFYRREDLPAGEGFGVGGEVLPAGDLRVRVTTTDGQSGRYDWARLDRRSTLDIRIGQNAVSFTEVD
jgi:hypothetical protein